MSGSPARSQARAAVSPAREPGQLYDEVGLAVTASSAEAVVALDRCVRSYLLHRADTPEHLASALASDPELLLGHVLQGFLWRLLARRDLAPRIAHAIALAERSAKTRGATARERLLLAALRSWHQGEVSSALASLQVALEGYPACLLSMKLLHSVAFMYGELLSTRRVVERSVAVSERNTVAHGLRLGCYAFVLEESGSLLEAERVARGALESMPSDVWAFHALLHVYTAQQRHELGLTLRSARAKGDISWQFEGGNNFLAHLSWHHALLAIHERQYDEALALYDRELAPSLGRDYRDFANCVSLLVRLERAGVAVGARSRRLADLAEAQLGDHSLAFADAHYVLALLAAGRVEAAENFARSLLRSCAREDVAAVYSRAGASLVLGLCALWGGALPDRASHEGALRGQALCELASLSAERLQCLGGSHVQRELFLQLSRDAAKRRSG